MARTYSWRLASVPWSRDQEFVLGYRYGLPLLCRNAAPRTVLATYRQLRAMDPPMRPGGQDPVALLMGRHRASCSRWLANLYLIEQAKPVRPMTPARVVSIERALIARRTCRECGWVAYAELPRAHRTCEPCRYERGELDLDDPVHELLDGEPIESAVPNTSPWEVAA